MFECEQCDKKFSRKFNKIRHIDRVHKLNSRNLKKQIYQFTHRQPCWNPNDNPVTKVKINNVASILSSEEASVNSKNASCLNSSLNGLSEIKQNIDENYCDVKMKRFDLGNTFHHLNYLDDSDCTSLLTDPNQLVDQLRKLYETSVGKEILQIVIELRNVNVIE